MATPTSTHQTSTSRRPGSFSKSHPPSRPTTPLRPTSRTSLRESSSAKRRSSRDVSNPNSTPLKDLEPAFAELADGMADLEANFMHLQLMHESLARFTEDFGSLLYGLNVNAFCVDFPETPLPESFKRTQHLEANHPLPPRSAETQRFHNVDGEAEATFLTTDTSFVENPPISSRSASRFETPAPPRRTTAAPARGGSTATGGREGRGAAATGRGTAARGGRGGSGIARGKARGVR
ncbi:MAG: DASH complex subunit dam1 [Bogoriella megaspora]|nr:MAG: DASH complex subunit dam1 [Bogoriella megaspora]